MAGMWISERFPQFEPSLRNLTRQHLELKVEPLHLAIAYLPRREGQEDCEGIFLFEVLGGAAEQFNQEEDLFEVTYDSVPGLSTGFDQTLHLILTTPSEIKRRWRRIGRLPWKSPTPCVARITKCCTPTRLAERSSARYERQPTPPGDPPVDESFAWLLQAAADREAAEQLAAGQCGKGYCHAIAKWQQTVEKAVKAMVAALRE